MELIFAANGGEKIYFSHYNQIITILFSRVQIYFIFLGYVVRALRRLTYIPVDQTPEIYREHYRDLPN